MKAFLKVILDYFLSFISQYSFFIEWDYYKGLFSKYFSVGGFIIGFIFVVLVFFSYAEDQNKAGFLKVLTIVAVINSCVVLTNFLDTAFGQGFGYSGTEMMFNAPDNIISGFILTLVICSCYRKLGGNAFLFGIATHAALPLLNFSYFGDMSIGVPILHMILRVVLIGLLCIIMSHRKYFFTSWIWYFGFHMFIRIAVFFLPLLCNLIDWAETYAVDYSLSSAIEYFSRFTIDGIAFAVVLVFAVVFEKGVLTAKSVQGTV